MRKPRFAVSAYLVLLGVTALATVRFAHASHLSILARTARPAQEEDAEGCKDSLLVSRYPGGHINSCENKEYEQAEMPVGKDKDGNVVTKKFEGEYHYWDIATHDGVSEIQVFRNFDAALKRGGFTVDYEGEPDTITAHKGNTWIMIESKGAYYYQTIVTVQEMKQEVTADASSLSDEIEKTGRVAVYGITFDTGKATILSGSEPVLGEIGKLMQNSPDLNLRVEGHTDNQGSAAANQALSEKRAQAVVSWLTAHGVAASRLTAQGFGQTKPVADNSTAEGRAKNRRVELVKR
jgi:OOP family OmpA-OmpF porin